ncbi:MAG: sodium:solute symporter family protein [Candidatus Krumholzibacteriota bacterium]|nr:sodium:solute symporter family protein [Candidatus Krumholzibacteriota bacterium]
MSMTRNDGDDAPSRTAMSLAGKCIIRYADPLRAAPARAGGAVIHLAVILVYLIALLGVGIWKARRVRTQADFAVAGRRLTPWVLVGTMLATWIGTGSVLGNAGKTYEAGAAAFLLPLGGVLGIALLTRVAGRVRRLGSWTVPEIIGRRFGDLPRVLSALALVIAYLVIVSYQYNAGGAVLRTVLVDGAGEPLLSDGAATAVAAAFIVAYTMLAGLLSVAYTDVANGVVMALAFAVTLPVLWAKAGGLPGMAEAFQATGRSDHMRLWGVWSGLDLVNFCLPPFLLVLGDANMFQRFSACRDARGATRATTALVFAVAAVELLIIACAWVAASLIPDAADGRHVLVFAAARFLPPLLGAVLLTTLVGVIISTADSYLLVPATTLVRDLWLRRRGGDETAGGDSDTPAAPDTRASRGERRLVLASRLVVLALGFIAYLVSRGFARSEGFFERALYAYTIYGAAITPSLLAALFWRGATRAGAVASIAGGVVTTLLWKEWLAPRLAGTWLGGVDEVIPAITVSVLCLVLGSLRRS